MIAQATMTGPRTRLARLGDRLARLAVRLVENSELNRRAEVAQRLSALSDAELARRGLRREDILRHAFGPMLAL